MSRLMAPVDAVLATPVVDWLVAEIEVVRDATTLSEPVKDLASKLSGVAPSSHLYLLGVRRRPEIQTPLSPGHTKSPDMPGRFTRLV